MSRIRFEWNIESQRIDRSDGEDPQAKSRRRRTALRLLLLVLLFIAALVVGALAVRQRLIDVETMNAQLLQDTVKAEVAAIRIGDVNTWLKVQDSTNESWMQRQRALYQHYNELKIAAAIDLTGDILAVEIENDLARVLVQENINAVPYARLWFYARTEDGWLHRAPVHSFWGAPERFIGPRVRIDYRSVDQQFVEQLAAKLVDWLERSCSLLNCSDMPDLSVEVVADAPEVVAWVDERAMRLRLRSPYSDIARADLPFDGPYQIQASRIIAQRLTAEHTKRRTAIYPHDAYFIREAVSEWLSRWLLRIESGDSLIGSLAQNYGMEAVAHLLSGLSPTDDMSIVQRFIPDPISGAELEWRDFIEWRLRTEDELITARAEQAWLKLYDTSDESVRIAAYERFNRNAAARPPSVVDHVIWWSDDGLPQLRITARYEDESSAGDVIILFNLVNQVWKRAS